MAPTLVPPSQQSKEDLRCMDLAFEMAEEALRAGEIPVGCVLVRGRGKGLEIGDGDGDGDQGWEVVAKGRNRTNQSRNATLHAEFDALSLLLPHRSTYFTPSDAHPAVSPHEHQVPLSDLTLYVTVEPCLMCASALRQVGIGMVIYGCANERFGGCGGVQNVHDDPRLIHSPPYVALGGYKREEAIMLLRRFYITENVNAPVPRKKMNRTLKFDIPPVSTPVLVDRND
ncbi:cytidine deaminase-like protein [Atractiella rhizophila]|nr:cytidine deaminase-like protein [Atractiella rhizophila]